MNVVLPVQDIQYPRVTACYAKAKGNGSAYWTEFETPWQPPHTTQKRPPAKKAGIWLSRVTTILNELNKHSLYEWYAQCTADWWRERLTNGMPVQSILAGYWESVKAAKVARDLAAEIGTQVHQVVQLYLETGRWPDCQGAHPEALHAMACWQDWWSSADLTPVAVEKTVWSLRGGYAGTLDLLARNREGQLEIVDLKTSGKLHKEYAWQLAAYATALEEMGEPVPDRATLVRLPKRFDQERPEVVTVWDSPETRRQLQLGWTAFTFALSLRPKAFRSSQDDLQGEEDE